MAYRSTFSTASKAYTPRWATTSFGKSMLNIPGISHMMMGASEAYAGILGRELKAHGEASRRCAIARPPRPRLQRGAHSCRGKLGERAGADCGRRILCGAALFRLGVASALGWLRGVTLWPSPSFACSSP